MLSETSGPGPFYDRPLVLIGAVLGSLRCALALVRGERFGAEATVAAVVATACIVQLVREACFT
jgi:hypothetical protein